MVLARTEYIKKIVDISKRRYIHVNKHSKFGTIWLSNALIYSIIQILDAQDERKKVEEEEDRKDYAAAQHRPHITSNLLIIKIKIFPLNQQQNHNIQVLIMVHYAEKGCT